MIRLATDQNFRRSILRGLLRRVSGLDILRVQDFGLSAADDPALLAWAEAEGRVLLTHDVNTMPDYAYARLEANLPMPGLIIVPQTLPAGSAIDDLVLIVECGQPEDFAGQVVYLPL